MTVPELRRAVAEVTERAPGKPFGVNFRADQPDLPERLLVPGAPVFDADGLDNLRRAFTDPEAWELELTRFLEERVADALRALARARDLLPQLPGGGREVMAEALARVEAELGGASLSERRQAFLDSLHKGQFVFLPRYKKRCIVQKVDKGRRELVVRIGSMDMRVSFDEVTSYEAL